ncbi:hypothetical protein ABQF26_37110, partial [Mycolicibacterium elephantis]
PLANCAIRIALQHSAVQHKPGQGRVTLLIVFRDTSTGNRVATTNRRRYDWSRVGKLNLTQ